MSTKTVVGGRRRHARRGPGMVMALAVVAATVVLCAPAPPAAGATFPSSAFPDTLDVTGDSSGRLLGAWVQVIQEPFTKSLQIARTQAGSSAPDTTFDGDGRRTVDLELPPGWGWATAPDVTRLANIEAAGFDSDGNVVVVWFAIPWSCGARDWCDHGDDRLMIDRYTIGGTRLSRTAQVVPPAGTWCGGELGYEELCSPTADNSPRVKVLDNGTVALSTFAAYEAQGGQNGVRFYDQQTGAVRYDFASGTQRPGFVWARGATGAVVNEAAGGYGATAITNWSSAAPLPSANFCATTGSATTTATVRTCFAASGSSLVTRYDGAGALDWQRTIPYGPSDAALEGTAGSLIKLSPFGTPTVSRFGPTGTPAQAAVPGSNAYRYAPLVALSATNVGLGRVDQTATTVELLVIPVGSGPTTVPPPAPFDSWPAMIDRQFRDLVGRAATSSEITTWRNQLQSGTATPGALPAALRTSSDHTTNVDPVTRLYAAYLARTPDAGGLNYWIGRRRRGTTLSTISSNFAGSSEFQRLYGPLSNRAFVQLVYTNVLGRPGEASGIDYWTRQLDLRRRTRGSVMVGFSESSENIRVQGPRVHVIVLYVQMLGRAPSSSELSTEIAALGSGGTVAQLAQRILDSAAYATRVGGA